MNVEITEPRNSNHQSQPSIYRWFHEVSFPRFQFMVSVDEFKKNI